MTVLTVTVPRFSSELEWIISVLLNHTLGIVYRLEVVEAGGFGLSRGNRRIDLPDIFFAFSANKWLHRSSLPAETLAVFDVEAAGLRADTVSKIVPVIYGDSHRPAEISGEKIYLPIDLFGSAFLMLSRYEEAVIEERDAHGRFPASASVAFRNRFLDRPIIDEYVEILWACIKIMWPDMERKSRACKTVVSCDVDHPYHASARSLSRLMKRTAAEIVRKRTCADAIRPIRNYLASRRGDWKNDPYYYTVDWMMDANEKAGNKVAFYFIPEITDTVMDGRCSINDAAVRAMLRRISDRGHEIGIHPGYRTHQSASHIAAGKSALERVMGQEGIRQKIAGGRQHYLRWSTRTPANWEAAGLDYDSTLSYADHAGFRCGTCHEYPMYDLHERKRLRLLQRPLICMETTLIDSMGLGYTESALEEMKKLKHAVRQVNGKFTLLWHNSSFESCGAREMYCEIIG
jgi:hypothetical protein